MYFPEFSSGPTLSIFRPEKKKRPRKVTATDTAIEDEESAPLGR